MNDIAVERKKTLKEAEQKKKRRKATKSTEIAGETKIKESKQNQTIWRKQ